MDTATRHMTHVLLLIACLLLSLQEHLPHARADASGAPTTAHYTYLRSDGNRVVAGQGRLPTAFVLDIPVPARPDWLVGAPLKQGSLWVAVLSDGSVRAWRVYGRRAEPLLLLPTHLRPGTPPVVGVQGAEARLLSAPLPGMASPVSHPVLVSPITGLMAFLDTSGALRLWQQRERARLDIQALPDARILVDAQGRLLVFTSPTTRYAHGVLGDKMEAAKLTLIATTPRPQVMRTIEFTPPAVAEGIAPIWTDVNGDGQTDILVTLSDDQQGARLVVFNEAGQQMAASEAIGQGYRWRHQLAVAPFGPQGEMEVAAVLTPHIGGVVEFFRLVGNELRLIAQVSGTAAPGTQSRSSDAILAGDFTTVPMEGFGSHVLGSRNLDMAAAGDFDGDGRVELLVPNQPRTHLGGIRRIDHTAAVVWSVPVGGALSTNLAAVTLADGSMAVGVGHTGRTIRLWLPR